jgi:hypothetical protein
MGWIHGYKLFVGLSQDRQPRAAVTVADSMNCICVGNYMNVIYCLLEVKFGVKSKILLIDV